MCRGPGMDACCGRSWIAEELSDAGFVLPYDEASQSTRKGSTCSASLKLQAGIGDDCASFVGSLKACTRNKDLHRGTRLHEDILRRGLLEKCSDALVTMYAKCGELGKAKVLLDTHKSRDVVTWTAIISGYAQAGRGQNALDFFESMRHEGVLPNVVTYTCALKACATIAAAEKGKEIHDEIVRRGLLQQSITLGTALVDMYVKCGALSKAQDVLQSLPSRCGNTSGGLVEMHNTRDVITWTALISGYAQQGQAQNALDCYDCMQREGISPNAFTYACILKACGAIGAVNKGKNVHNEITRQGLLQNDIVLGTALVDMYAKCGALLKAQKVFEELHFRTVVSWNALIGGYAQEGQSDQALSCFERMQQEGGLPDAITYACVLKACATLGDLERGKQIHDKIESQGLLQNNGVLATALVDMYAKCGALSAAQTVHNKLCFREVGFWNALAAGFAQEGQGEEVLDCFERMQHEGIPPDAVTYACILKACGILGMIEKGLEIHDKITRQGLLQNNLVLGAALVDMYVKCGALSKAQLVLEELPSRTVVQWSALIAGYAQEGQGKQVLTCFERMQNEGILPNVVTFTCVLNVCSHLGLVEEGHAIFMSMTTKYDVTPNLECYTCMVDLFGRAGHLEKAVQLIQKMPSSDYSAIWLSLLGACQKWGDVNVARWAFEQALHVDKSDGPAYVLMANIYAAAGMLEYAKDITTMSIKNKAWKKPGRSWWINSNEDVYAFSNGDVEHAQGNSIIKKLEEIAHKMSDRYYSLGSPSVSRSISNVVKDHLFCHHAEVQALACALINTPQGSITRIVKNMRLCSDCHVAISLISKVEMRTIVVMEGNARHWFQGGNCSCKEYL
ncbi:hypothetical protein GOP47_0001021 [Adiantum capillus-veneris]|uniref:DYW domain-containing protein n=1 Tax=Adiantum capillus-veneris TaxID=13818 RepID=A0A9D4VG93_ADICA|nr:hypothetical protein GOP47_0001021 [Adiantum capillus-veneris]